MKVETDFIAMLGLLAKAAAGNDINIGQFNRENVLRYADEQSVLPLVCSQLPELAASGKILRMAAKNISDLAYIRLIFNELEKNGIKFAVLKGESVACLYQNPDLRISGDVDILMDEADEAKALYVFEKYGYRHEERKPGENENVLIHPMRKIVELHVALYDKTREDIFFGDTGNAAKPYIKVSSPNMGEFYALAPDDGIMFLYLHFIKHFLSSGAGVRQLLDIVMYSKRYKNEIDWQAFFEKIDKIHYKKMYSYILSAAVKYMGFEKSDFRDVEYDFEAAEKVLADLQYSGLFGKNEENLAQFKRVYEEKRNQKYGFVDYEDYSKKYTVSKIKILFPSAKVLRGRYKYLEKHRWLLPAAWVQRIVSAGLAVVLGRKDASRYTSINKIKTNQDIEQRIKLMEDIDML